MSDSESIKKVGGSGDVAGGVLSQEPLSLLRLACLCGVDCTSEGRACIGEEDCIGACLGEEDCIGGWRVGSASCLCPIDGLGANRPCFAQRVVQFGDAGNVSGGSEPHLSSSDNAASEDATAEAVSENPV